MSDPTYLWHLTLDTGHGRRSYRDEVDDTVVALLGQQLGEMLAGLQVEVMPGYRLTGAAASGALLATVSGQDGPLATIAVAPSGRTSARLWEELRKPGNGAVAVGNPPQPPWCAVRLYPALLADAEAIGRLGDLERCVAWAWIERRA